jgi:hypothetical protein
MQLGKLQTEKMKKKDDDHAKQVKAKDDEQ